MKSLLTLLALITVCGTTAIAQTSVPKPNSPPKVAPMQVMSQEAAPKPTLAKQSGQKTTDLKNSVPSSPPKVAPMQVMSQTAAPKPRPTLPKQSGQKITEPQNSVPKPNSPPKVAPMQVMSQEAVPMSRSATQPVAPAAVPPKKK